MSVSVERKLLIARLLRSVALSDRTYHLEFEIADGVPFTFLPGQFISMLQENGGREVTRAYSLASAPRDDNHFDLCLNRVDLGFFSNYLCDISAGAELRFHGPHGYFVPRQPVRDSLFIANGTGIAPIRSMLQWIFADPARHESREFWLLYGTRSESDIYYRQEFLDLARAFPNFHYLVTISRPSPGWTGLRGWVQDHVREIASGRNDADAYICGLKDMVTANRKLLQELGWERRSILYERFD